MSNDQNLKELREQGSMVALLAGLGYQPARQSGREKMYCSMLRDNDKVPSFAVNDELGVWFDHGTRKGGNMIDFGLAYWPHLNFPQVVEKLMEVTSGGPRESRPMRPRKQTRLPNYVIYETKDIGTHPAITEYLKSRGIFYEAKAQLSEVYYYVEDQKGERKDYYAAGWKNENGAWEVRNKYFKGCLGHKGISLLPGHAKSLAVFEGFLNYLSWKKENPAADHSVMVLNSLSLLRPGIERAKAFSSIDIYFDRDAAGFSAAREFIRELPYTCDRSVAYAGYNDYNDKIRSSGLPAPPAVNRTFELAGEMRLPFKR